MGRERALDRVFAGGLVGERDERLGVVALLERAVSKAGDARRPGGAVLDLALRLELRAERDQLAHVRDRRHGARGRESDEALRVQVVAEQQDRVLVTGREQARASVVDEVALVDRLHGQGEARVRERGEDGDAVAGAARTERFSPQRAVAFGLERDLLPEVSLRRAHGRPPPSGRSPRRRARGRRTWLRTARAGRTRPDRACPGSTRRTWTCRIPRP